MNERNKKSQNSSSTLSNWRQLVDPATKMTLGKLSKLLLSLSKKELINRKQLVLFMTFNLFLGLVSFTLIDSFKVSLSRHIDGKSQEMFTADLRVYGRRMLKENESQYLVKQFADASIAQKVSFYTMSRAKEQSRLADISVITSNYPLYGQIVFEDFDGNVVSREQATEILSEDNAAALFPDLKYLYELEDGDSIEVGDQTFIARLVVRRDAGGSVNFSGLAPKVYIFDKNYDVEALGKRGNLVRYLTYVKLPESLPKNDLENVRKQTYDELLAIKEADSSPLTVRSHSGSGSQIESVLGYVSNFLSLVSLIALFLSGVGIAYLFHTFVHGKIKNTAIIRSLGLTQNQTFVISVLQLLIIGLFSSVLASVLSYFLVPYVPVLFQGYLPEGFAMVFSLRSAILTYLVSVGGAVLFCLPILISSRDLSLGYLFTGRMRYLGNQNLALVTCICLIGVCFFLMASWLADDWFVGLVFSACFFGLFFVLFAVGMLSAASLRLLFSRLGYLSDFAIKSIHFNKFSTIFFFLSLSLGAMLITSISQMENSINAEMSQPEGVVFPTFFLFNISGDELENLNDFVSEKGYALENTAPILGARLMAINEQELKPNDAPMYGRPDEEAWRERDNRRINLSYREGLIGGETLKAGVPFDEAEVADGHFKLSIEDEYAKERNVKLGDVLTFQMLDLPATFKAEIVNYREVKWNSFQPNFWLILEPAALEQYPKLFLASISGVKDDEKQALQSAVVGNFPNVSMLDVRAIISELLSIINQVSILVKVMALFSIVLGLFILFSIVHHQSRSKWKEINMLKVLGMDFGSIRRVVATEYLILGSYSLIMGMLLGVVFSYVIATVFFDGRFTLGLSYQVYLFFGLMAAILVICLFATAKPLAMPANSLLKETAV